MALFLSASISRTAFPCQMPSIHTQPDPQATDSHYFICDSLLSFAPIVINITSHFPLPKAAFSYSSQQTHRHPLHPPPIPQLLPTLHNICPSLPFPTLCLTVQFQNSKESLSSCFPNFHRLSVTINSYSSSSILKFREALLLKLALKKSGVSCCGRCRPKLKSELVNPERAVQLQ